MIALIRDQLHHWLYARHYADLIANQKQYPLEQFERLNCIYIHVPKAAGISICRSLFGNAGPGHRTALEYRRIFGPLRYYKLFRFTFVRNPYDRLYSAYRFLARGGINQEDQDFSERVLSRYKSFAEFVHSWLDEKSLWSYVHFRPQSQFVCDQGGTPAVNFIGRFENLESDFDTVATRLGLSCKLQHVNAASERRSWREVYDQVMLKKVASLYSPDFGAFGYVPELL